MDKSLVYCAIDTSDCATALSLADEVAKAGCGIKLGLEFFVGNGPEGVGRIRAAHPQQPIFLDLKFHDIPHTVAGAVRAAARLGVAYVNVHAGGGRSMMLAAQQAVQEEAKKYGLPVPKLLAVTVLTSLDVVELSETGIASLPAAQVLRLAELAKDCGFAGVVCAAEEIALLRREHGPDFVLMVPGIRPEGSAQGDQKRVMTPQEAMGQGATHLVIGRPITGAESPFQAAKDILESLGTKK